MQGCSRSLVRGLLHHGRSTWGLRRWFSEDPSDTPVIIPSGTTVVSFYQLKPIAKTALPELQQTLQNMFASLRVFGRVYLSEEGINAQVSVPKENLDLLRDQMAHLSHFPEPFLFNESTSTGQGSFEKLRVKVRDQVLADGHLDYDLTLKPTSLEPSVWHQELVQQVIEPEQKALLLDMRNSYETEIGRFKHAIEIPALTFREQLKAMLDYVYEHYRGQTATKPIYLCCTGGIRCSKAGALLRTKGYKDVRMVRFAPHVCAFHLNPTIVITMI